MPATSDSRMPIAPPISESKMLSVSSCRISRTRRNQSAFQCSRVAILHAKHVEFKRLMVLTITAYPRLSYINDNHLVLADHVRQLAFVVWRQLLSKAFAKRPRIL